MNIRPAENWYWYFDEKLDALMLDLSNDMVFRSRYTKKMLIADALYECPFSVHDATVYYQLYESCSSLPLSEPSKVELVLNALAVRNYLKPQMPKSWYFVQQPRFFVPELSEVVCACVQESFEQIDLLTVDIGDNASLCLIAQPSVTMSGKLFCLGDAIKVMHDRLASKNTVLQEQNQASHLDDEPSLLNHFLSKVC